MNDGTGKGSSSEIKCMSLNYYPFAENEDLQKIGQELRSNVKPPERVFSVIGGLALIATGVALRGAARWASWTAGAALFYRGASGHCSIYEHLDISRRDSDPSTQN